MTNQNEKIKIYRNPGRNQAPHIKPYVPQYQLMGLAPKEYHSPLPSDNSIVVDKAPPSVDNPRASRPPIRQPYAEIASSPVGRGRGPLPNVGNNLEQTWSSVDGEIIDDISQETLFPDHPVVDNNEFVSATALGLPENEILQVEEGEISGSRAQSVRGPELKVEGKSEKYFLTEDDLQGAIKEENLSGIIHSLEEEEYLLVVNGSAICSGHLSYIQQQVRELVFGEHLLCNNNPMSLEAIAVIKRIQIKVGVFL